MSLIHREAVELLEDRIGEYLAESEAEAGAIDGTIEVLLSAADDMGLGVLPPRVRRRYVALLLALGRVELPATLPAAAIVLGALLGFKLSATAYEEEVPQ